MAKADPKDDRIAELELQLEASNKATTEAATKAQQVDALNGEIEKLTQSVKTRDKRILDLEGELTQVKDANSAGNKATIRGLDAENAIQLKVSSIVTNALTGARIDAVAGDVLVEKESFHAVSVKVVTAAKVHPVSKDELAAAKTSGRAH